MRWRQFFTPVQSIDAPQARELIAGKAPEDLVLLDVRQPGEYENGHLPGAKLIPLPDLGDRLDEIEPDRTIVVYCAIGGRSRMAAQMLSGKGFSDIYNLSGGFKAWNSQAAYGAADVGLELLSGKETPEDALVIAYSLEQGLRDFYLSMLPKTQNTDAKQLFEKLAEIEIKHQERIFDFYTRMSDNALSREAFESRMVAGVVEGGLTTDDYLRMFQPDLNHAPDVVDLAMSIEAQALDLYVRAAEKSEDADSREIFLQIAGEEKAHLKQLGQLMDRLVLDSTR